MLAKIKESNMTWHKVTMNSEQVANKLHSKLQNQFKTLFMDVKAPIDMALFSSNFSSNDEINIYFSPGSIQYASSIISQYGGVKCDQPNEKPSLLVGHADASNQMFSDEPI